MKLMTDQLAAKIPKLYESELKPNPDKVAYAKFFHPVHNWAWYVIEYDGKDECFGLVVGAETELGYFGLRELEEVDWYGVGVERDIHFQPTPLRELRSTT